MKRLTVIGLIVLAFSSVAHAEEDYCTSMMDTADAVIEYRDKGLTQKAVSDAMSHASNNPETTRQLKDIVKIGYKGEPERGIHKGEETASTLESYTLNSCMNEEWEALAAKATK